MRIALIAMGLAWALAGAARADEPALRESWVCRGVTQTTPGEPVAPQERRVVFDYGSGTALMTIDGKEYRAPFKASRMHAEAVFEVVLDSGKSAMEDVTLGRQSGRLVANAESNGTRLRIYRANCQPAEAPAPPSR